jgi:hypothetical protein
VGSVAWQEALYGALGGAAASMAAAAAIAERGERGRLRAQERRRLRAVIDRWAQWVQLAELRRGEGPAMDLVATQPETQIEFARDVLDSCGELGVVRRRRIRSALRELVGPLHVRLAEEAPHNPNDRGGDAERQSLFFLAEPEKLERELQTPGALDLADKSRSSDRAWADVKTAMRRLRRAV